MAIGTISNGELAPSVRTKLNAALGQLDGTTAFGERIALAAGVTGDSETVTLSSNAATIPLDGRCYVLDLDSATNNVTLSFSTPSGASYAFCTIVIIQGSTARSVDFYDTVDQTDQDWPTANNARSTWAVITPDSGTTYQLHGCGA